MPRRLRSHLTFANVVSFLALFIVLGGASYAAIKLPANSVGSKQLRNSAVTSAKVKDGVLLAKDFRKGQLPAGLPGPKGADGAQGSPGPPGATGPRGPSDAWAFYVDQVAADLNSSGDALVVSSDLPDGDYLVFANAMIANNTPGTITVHCRLITAAPYGDSFAADISDVVVASGETGNLVLTGPHSMPATQQNPNKLGIDCATPSPTPASGTVVYSDIDLDFLQIGTGH